ncbi:MAG: hypothetical protein N2322_02960, partial [Terrimicrobiaceae bacterium]|nr:hypothetical protein [Terrimicrobiaceae bacterium]
ALMGATTAQELREVAEKYAGFAAGRTARMVLAARLAAEGNATAASAEYQAFATSFPESPLAGPARIALATLALADGQQKRGLDLLNEASASGDAFTAQMGLLFKAREQIAAGDFAGARNALQLLVTSHGLSPAARVSQGLFQQIAAIDPQQGIASAADGAQPSLRISAPQPSQP